MPTLAPEIAPPTGATTGFLKAHSSPDRIAPFPNDLHGVSRDDALAALDKRSKADVAPARVAAIIDEPVPIGPPAQGPTIAT